MEASGAVTALSALLLASSVALLFSSVNASTAFSAEENDEIDEEANADYRPDRTLTKEEVEKIRKLSQTLLTKTIASDDSNVRNRWQGRRCVAATRLGSTHHRDALPALITTLKDSTNPEDVHVYCVTALKGIYDKRVVDALLDVCVDEHGNVEAHAQSVLNYIFSRNFLSSDSWTKERRKQEVQKWRDWWNANRDKMELDRARLGDREWLQPRKVPKGKAAKEEQPS